MHEPADLARIGLKPEDAAVWMVGLGSGQRLARVVLRHRNSWAVDDGGGEFTAGAPAPMCRPGGDPTSKPIVGDWVVLADGLPPMIERLIERRNAIARIAAGERHVAQLIAANIDRVLIVSGLDEDFNPRRIERYLLLARASEAAPLLVLTKVDCSVHAAARLLDAQTLFGSAMPVIALNARSPEAASALAPYISAGVTAVLVGSSGAGKSTLTNTLLGEARQATGPVRASDGRGRHTTSSRTLLRLPGGACLIDTPGMRELKLTGAEALDDGAFADIDELAAQCRFRDCRHAREPGCAVLAAIAAGQLGTARLASFRKLGDEQRAAQAVSSGHGMPPQSGAPRGRR